MHTVLFLQPFLLCWFRVTTSVAASLTQPSALSCWLQKGGFLFGIPCISFRAAAHGIRSSFAARRDQRRCPLQVLGFFLPRVLDRSRCCVPGGGEGGGWAVQAMGFNFHRAAPPAAYSAARAFVLSAPRPRYSPRSFANAFLDSHVGILRRRSHHHMALLVQFERHTRRTGKVSGTLRRTESRTRSISKLFLCARI